MYLSKVLNRSKRSIAGGGLRGLVFQEDTLVAATCLKPVVAVPREPNQAGQLYHNDTSCGCCCFKEFWGIAYLLPLLWYTFFCCRGRYVHPKPKSLVVALTHAMLPSMHALHSFPCIHACIHAPSPCTATVHGSACGCC